MNVLAPYSWIKEYLKTETGREEFANEMSLIGNSVERQIEADAFMNEFVVVGRVSALNPHPNADALQIATADVGGGTTHQIVCGGDNLYVGQLVPVAMPGAVVSWHGEDTMELKAAKIRGEESFGMICAAEELGFPQLANEKNIWDLKDIVTEDQVGQRLSEALDLSGDVTFDIEVTTNRPDCMSMLGQAREAFAAKLGTYEELTEKLELPTFDGEEPVLSVSVEDAGLCPRYMGLVLDVEVGPSPWWMQKRLLLAGAKPINNVVDVTNYVRLELGQPLHAFDFDKIAGGKIVARAAKDGEKMMALDEEEYELTKDMCVIADANGPVAIGGVMGGLDSGTYEGTKRIVLEAAAFNALAIRNTWRTLHLQSDSQALYEKGLSPELPALGMARAVELLKDVASAKVASSVQDVYPATYKAPQFELDTDRVNALMGVEVAKEEQIGILERLGFRVEANTVTVPVWRDEDIEGDVDLTEEIARVWGYHNLPSTLPTGSIPRRERDTLLAREEEIKDLLAGMGCMEVYANSFDDPEDVKRAGLNPADHLRVENPLAEDQALMRTNLVPTMLRVLSNNQHHPASSQLFELSRVYLPREGDLPQEQSMLLVAVMDDKGGEDLFRRTKGIIEHLADAYRIEFGIERSDNVPSYIHPGRSGMITVEGTPVGGIGEVHPLVQKAYDLDKYVCLVGFNLPILEPHLKLDPSYTEPSEFPSVYRDLAFVVPEAAVFADLVAALRDGRTLLQDIELFDVYRGKGVESGQKSIAVHLTFAAEGRTLESEEVDQEIAAMKQLLEKTFEVTVRD